MQNNFNTSSWERDHYVY